MAETTRQRVLSLSGMWVSAGSPAGRRHDDWKKDGSHREFKDQVAMVANVPVKGIWKGTRGNGGGTMAHPAENAVRIGSQRSDVAARADAGAYQKFRIKNPTAPTLSKG